MREALRKYVNDEYAVYGVAEHDFEDTVELARTMVNAQMELVRQEDARVRAAQPEMADDIMDDIAAHTYTNAQYIWHFCLWRLQGLLEDIVVRTFLERTDSRGLTGLKAKLDALTAAGFTIAEVDRVELLDWGRVRNALSHSPPERFRPGPLTEDDVTDYQRLISRLCSQWREKQARRGQSET